MTNQAASFVRPDHNLHRIGILTAPLQPVHASGRYNRNTLIEILVNDFGFTKCYRKPELIHVLLHNHSCASIIAINRLDRLTSGLMIIPLSAERAREITSEFAAGTVKKEYVARVRGRFPS